MVYVIPVKQENYVRAVLETLTPFLKLTEYEREIISQMLTSNIKTINTKTRQDLITLLDTDYYTLANYLKKLKDKHILVDTGYGLALSAELANSLYDKEINISFKILQDEVNQG